QVMDGFAFPVEVVRTDRKRSASIYLEGDLVKVRVPKTLSDTRIRDLINKRTPWIKKKLKEWSEKPVSKPKEYVSGETFPYLGRNYRLKVISGNTPSIKLKNGYLQTIVEKTDKNPQATIRSLLEDWYRSHAELRLAEKTKRWAKIVGVAPRSVSIKNYKSRWGSCAINGDIAYNWRVILAPHRIVDYVVIHELCHLLEHSHSPKYWKHVEKYFPDWKDCRGWLRNNSIV
ncbi:uncharacterized protein METZ01_LOCUS512133, partial [marine metagenome]